MILLCGIPSEPPLALAAEALARIGAPYAFFNQRNFAATEMAFEISASGVSGWLEMDGLGVPLQSIVGVYSRLMDFQRLPELRGEPADSPATRHCAALQDTLTRWTEISPARVVNRIAPMGSNSSKPYQAQLIRRYGFEVPETLITNDPDAVLAFRARVGRIIYKSISGVRSIVQTFDDRDVTRLDAVRLCPTQFQQYVEGTDVRVHVVGRQVFATAVKSDATDYRYARTQSGAAAQLSATEIADDVAERCTRLTQGLGLAFSGIDLKFAPDGRAYCFEVNPCPGYSYFEANSDQPISLALARYLSGSA
ncbi:MAG: ATP-grasp domain-containing protein [Gemmatimonadota bacterium]